MDSILLTLVNEAWTHPWLDALMIGLTTAGLVAIGLLPVATWQRGPRRLVWSLLGAQAAALIGVLVFYWLAGRTRPDAVRLVMAAPPLPSFPSGHAALAAATATAWWLHARAEPGWWSRSAWAVVLLALGVAYSRIYLGHHFPTDVLAGVVWGAGVGAAAHGMARHWGNRRAMVSSMLWPQIALALVVTGMAYLGLTPYFMLAWPYADKVFHMLLVGSLAFWLNLWLPEWQLQWGRVRLPVAIALPLILAAIEEALQSLSPVRTFDLGDLASDALGLLLFYALSRWALARMPAPAPTIMAVQK